jgi:choline dehydrogenase-like flavoprotein
MAGDGDYDVVIVGSGAGGGTVAAALTEAGYRTCVLEKGPHYTEADFIHDELRICRRFFFTPDPLEEPNAVARDGGAPAPSADGWISCCVGGGTVHMSGFFYRLRPDDLKLRTLHGAPAGSTVADWPIDYAELAHCYDEIERRIGVSGDATQLPLAQTAFPLGPMAQHPASALIDGACGKLGLRVFQTPRAILSSGYEGRRGCMYCGFCAGYGCEAGAKSSTLVSMIPAAATTGKLELVPHAMALRIETDTHGRAAGVVWTDGKAIHRAKGRAIVVAGGAVQTARLLLASGLANQSGLVGKNLMFSGQSRSSGRYTLPHASFTSEFPFIDRTIADFYVTRDRRFSHPKAGVMVFTLPHVNPISRAQLAADRGDDPPLWGAALTERLRRTFRAERTIEVETFAEFFPHAGSFVSLDDKLRDKFGQPAARITTSLHAATRRAAEVLRDEGERVLAATGAAIERPPGEPDVYWVLQAGTARMAAHAKDGVVGPDGHAFDVPNLYVADGSPLPTAGGAPFTLTIMANALRIARGLIARGSRGEL